jgi:hypothetical protein
MATQLNRRPLARDGASIVRLFDGWVLFGGDRHKSTFNDTWILSQKEISKLL